MALLAVLQAPLAGAEPVCSLDVVGCGFGPYDVFSTAPRDSTGSITVSCQGSTGPVPVTLTLDAGWSGDAARRTMSSGAGALEYNLFVDASRTQVWGDGFSGTSNRQLSVDGSPVTVSVFGRIPEGQVVPPGTYADTVVVTVSF
ncbi:hypothetical protein KH5H1_61010 [Corallococcus caeni]|nr:hypothetical protein KH5H1_61010 [Corallococcus sp. KH5-1]